MAEIRGGCHCGNISVTAELTRATTEYRPRACDCDFCRKHGAAYLSDPAGSLRIAIRDARATAAYRQGSGTAEFLVCTTCGVLVAVLYRDDRIYAALNANAVVAELAPTQPVSPKQLATDDKVARWRAVWFADVVVG